MPRHPNYIPHGVIPAVLHPDSYSFRYTHSKKGVPSLPAELKRINLRHFAEMAERLADYLDAVDTAVGVVHDAKQEMELFSPVGISFSICHGPRSPSSSSLERNLRMFGGFIALTAPFAVS